MSDLFQALAHPVRRDILAMLRERAMSAGEIADAFAVSKPTMSGHFAVLKEAGLVTVERRGASLIYRINLSVAEEAVAGLMALLRIDPATAPRRSGKGKAVSS